MEQLGHEEEVQALGGHLALDRLLLGGLLGEDIKSEHREEEDPGPDLVGDDRRGAIKWTEIRVDGRAGG